MALNRQMLQGMMSLAQQFSFNVSETAGGSHSVHSRHYAGVAFDATHVNGERVMAGKTQWRQFLQVARNLGATELLGPGDPGHSTHVHAAWPRPVTESIEESSGAEPEECEVPPVGANEV